MAGVGFRGWRCAEGQENTPRVAGGLGTKQRSLAHILLCILLFWLANIQDGRPPVILDWWYGVCVSSHERARVRA